MERAAFGPGYRRGRSGSEQRARLECFSGRPKESLRFFYRGPAIEMFPNGLVKALKAATRGTLSCSSAGRGNSVRAKPKRYIQNLHSGRWRPDYSSHGSVSR